MVNNMEGRYTADLGVEGKICLCRVSGSGILISYDPFEKKEIKVYSTYNKVQKSSVA